jgi:hypothetical protein
LAPRFRLEQTRKGRVGSRDEKKSASGGGASARGGGGPKFFCIARIKRVRTRRFGGGGRLQKSSTKSKAAAEAAAVAAYAAAVSRGASRDDAIEEAEFLADDWSDETGLANSKASLKYLRGDDTSRTKTPTRKRKTSSGFDGAV